MDGNKRHKERFTKLFNQLLDKWGQGGDKGKDLATAIGLTPAMVSGMKMGRKGTSYEHITRICDLFNLPPEYFALADENLTFAENKELVNEVMQIREALVFKRLHKKVNPPV